MNQETLIDLIKFAQSFPYIAGLLEDYDDVHMDRHHNGTVIRCGIRAAIDKIREVGNQVLESEKIAARLRNDFDVREARELLVQVSESICHVDVPANAAMLNGDDDEGIEYCRTALERAHKQCGAELRKLHARLSVIAKDACDAFNSSQSEAAQEYGVDGESQLTALQESVLTLIKEHPKGITGKDICNRIDVIQSTLTRHIIPKLKGHHYVKNRRGIGYYIDSK